MTETTHESPGERVRELRKRAGLSAADIQLRGGPSQATLYRVERAGVLTERTAEKLAAVLGCKLADLLPANGGRR